MKKRIRLTESDLHRIVEESVYAYLRENNENEGLWNAIKATGKWASNAMSGKGTNWRQSYNMYQGQDVVNNLTKNVSTLENAIVGIDQALLKDKNAQGFFKNELNAIRQSVKMMKDKIANFAQDNQRTNNMALQNGQTAKEANNDLYARYN